MVEVDRVDLVERDEVLDLDRLRLLGIERLELAGLDQHVAVGRQLVALDDVLVGDLVAGRRIDALLLDAHAGLAVELVKAHGLARHRGVQLDGDGDEPEGDGTGPDRPWHADRVSPRRPVSCRSHAHCRRCTRRRAVTLRPSAARPAARSERPRSGSGCGTLGGCGSPAWARSGSDGIIGGSGTTASAPRPAMAPSVGARIGAGVKIILRRYPNGVSDNRSRSSAIESKTRSRPPRAARRRRSRPCARRSSSTRGLRRLDSPRSSRRS